MSFHTISENVTDGSPLKPDPSLSFARRFSESYQRRLSRFSNVSDAVSRKLSATIGWRTVSVQEVINQSKNLSGQYMRMRLKRSGIYSRKLGLSQLPSTNESTTGVNSSLPEVLRRLQLLGNELETCQPKLYSSISSQVSVTIANEKSVSFILSSISRHLLKSEVSWAKLASLFSVAGGLAVDCVNQGHPEYIYGLAETMGWVIERDAAFWIAQQGGWNGLLTRYRPPDDPANAFQVIILSVFCLIVTSILIILVVRGIGNRVLS